MSSLLLALVMFSLYICKVKAFHKFVANSSLYICTSVSIFQRRENPGVKVVT